jgi:hypothetical protein
METVGQADSRDLLLGKFAIVTGTDIARVRVMMSDKTEAEIREALGKIQRGEASLQNGKIEYSATR